LEKIQRTYQLEIDWFYSRTLGEPFQELDPSGGAAQLFGGKHTLAMLVPKKVHTIPLQKSISKEVLALLFEITILCSNCKIAIFTHNKTSSQNLFPSMS
jgi:hypothetical protein